MNQPWTAFYWNEWAADTAHLTHTQYSIYHRLLAHYYRTNKALTPNRLAIARICYASSLAELEDLAYVLCEYFILLDDGYHNKRADLEIKKYVNIINERQLAGRKGGLAKARNLLQQKASQHNTTDYINTKSKSLGASHPDPKGTRIPVNFEVTSEMRAFALTNHLPNPDDQICAFVDYWTAKPGSAGRKLDWPATFRNWLRKAAEMKTGGNGNGSHGSNGTQRVNTQVARAANNFAAIQAVFGSSPSMDSCGGANGARQAPRLSTSHAPVLDAETKKFSR